MPRYNSLASQLCTQNRRDVRPIQFGRRKLRDLLDGTGGPPGGLKMKQNQTSGFYVLQPKPPAPASAAPNQNNTSGLIFVCTPHSRQHLGAVGFGLTITRQRWHGCGFFLLLWSMLGLRMQFAEIGWFE